MVTPYQPLQPVHRTQVQADPEEEVKRTGAKQGQVESAVDRGFREDQEVTTQDRFREIEQRDTGDAAEMVEQLVEPMETAGAVVEDSAPVQEPRRSGRVTKTNVKYSPDTWDLARD